MWLPACSCACAGSERSGRAAGSACVSVCRAVLLPVILVNARPVGGCIPSKPTNCSQQLLRLPLPRLRKDLASARSERAGGLARLPSKQMRAAARSFPESIEGLDQRCGPDRQRGSMLAGSSALSRLIDWSPYRIGTVAGCAAFLLNSREHFAAAARSKVPGKMQVEIRRRPNATTTTGGRSHQPIGPRSIVCCKETRSSLPNQGSLSRCSRRRECGRVQKKIVRAASHRGKARTAPTEKRAWRFVAHDWDTPNGPTPNTRSGV